MPQPQYSGEHERVRAALVAAYAPGQLCAICHKPMCGAPRFLDLCHRTDELGRRTGGWLGLGHRACNRSANSWNKLGKGTARTPEQVTQVKARESRRAAKRARAEFDRVQLEIGDG